MATATIFDAPPAIEGTAPGTRSPETRIRGRKVEGKSEAIRNGQPTLSPKSDNPDPKQSLQHILTNTDPPPKPKTRPQDQVTPSTPSKPDLPLKKPIIWIDGDTDKVEDKEDQASVQNDSYTRAAEFNPSHTMTVAHTRRNANGTIGSVYSGNKIRHLKKDDGIPLWRKDIQLEFLRCVFNDETPVFTKAYDGTKGHTFADIYVDAMARSSKTSKVLKDKLLADRDGAMHMAMICLLVNVGRMNTTLNCEYILMIYGRICADCSGQSSPRCALNYAHTIQYPRSKPATIPGTTNSFRMLLASSPFSKELPKTRISQVPSTKSNRFLFLVPTLSISSLYSRSMHQKFQRLIFNLRETSSTLSCGQL